MHPTVHRLSTELKQIISSKTFSMVMILFWMSTLRTTDSYYIVYVALAVLAGFGLATTPQKSSKNWAVNIFAIVFATMVTFANYRTLFDLSISMHLPKLAMCVVVFLGGIVVGRTLLLALEETVEKIRKKKSNPIRLRPFQVFLITWGIMLAVYLLVFFFALYPGCYSFDSNEQLRQVLSGDYINNNPFYHTILIKAFYSLGSRLFSGDPNAALACYTIFQIIVMSACFAYMLMTLAELKLSKKWLILLLALYVLLPYHIIYSATIWKDVLFGGLVLVLIVALVRILKNVGLRPLNYILLVVGALGCGLLRSNGFFALIALAGVVLIVFWKSHRTLGLALALATISVFILKGPVLNLLHIESSDTAESLSIPTQQIARVIRDADDLSQDERDLLSHLIDVDKVPAAYKPWLNDPIKDLIREHDQSYLKEHLGDFIKLYLSLGLRHPILYLEAWIDQTRGYWNGGYDFIVYYLGITENHFGISRPENANLIRLEKYGALYAGGGILSLFTSTGLMTWLLMALLYLEIRRRSPEGIIAILPLFLILGTLLIATPVFAEFRYAYSVYAALPFIVDLAFTTPKPRARLA